MSDKSKDFYKKLGDIEDEFIESADDVQKYKKNSRIKDECKDEESKNAESADIQDGDNVVVFENRKVSYKKILYTAAVLIIATIIGFIIKNNLFGKGDYKHVADEEDTTLSPSPSQSSSPTETSKVTTKPEQDISNFDIDFSDFGQSEYPVSTVYEELDGSKISDGYAVGMEADVNYVFDFDKDGKNELMCYQMKKTSSGYTGTLYMNNVVVFNLEKFGGKLGIVDLNSSDDKYDIYYKNGTNEDYFEYKICPIGRFNYTNSFVEGLCTSNIADISKWRFNVDNTPGLAEIYDYYEISGIACVLLKQQIQIDKNTSGNSREKFYSYETVLKDGNEYNIEKYYNQPSVLLKDVLVYSEPDDNSKTSTIKAQNIELKKIVVYQDDLQNDDDFEYGYIYIEAEDGSSGWMQYKHDLDKESADENADAYNSSMLVYYNSINGEMSSNYFRDYNLPE